MVPLPRADALGRKGGAASPPPWSECGRGEGDHPIGRRKTPVFRRPMGGGGGAPLGGLGVTIVMASERLFDTFLRHYLQFERASDPVAAVAGPRPRGLTESDSSALRRAPIASAGAVRRGWGKVGAKGIAGPIWGNKIRLRPAFLFGKTLL